MRCIRKAAHYLVSILQFFFFTFLIFQNTFRSGPQLPAPSFFFFSFIGIESRSPKVLFHKVGSCYVTRRKGEITTHTLF